MKKVGIIAAYKKEDIDQINRVAFEYIEVIEKAGATPYIIPCNVRNIESYISDMDAFIFLGGGDVDPSLYNEEIKGSRNIVRQNDEFSLKFMDLIIKSGKPMFGICKGMQLINVFFGGKLIQDIPNANFHYQYEKQYESIDIAILTENGFLHKIFGSKEIAINSIHHQSVFNLGKDLKIVAKSKHDGIIEGIEHNFLPIYGVQWHPECLKEHQKIFDWFVGL